MSSLVLCTSRLCYVRRHHFCGQLQTCAKFPNREWRMRCLVFVLSLSSSCRAFMLLSCLVFYCVITFKCYCLVLYCCLVLYSHSCVDQWSLSAPCVVICFVLCCHLFFSPLQLVRNEERPTCVFLGFKRAKSNENELTKRRKLIGMAF